MTHYNFKPSNLVCTKNISFDLDDENKIHNVSFERGCNGNLKAISKLVEGKDAKEVMEILKGNTCGLKGTSCADQFARAIEDAINTK
ncbi:MAG: TIGR03905 family TSCPD domain-containing protein [Gammaproteobacteria bacterium]|nr:TIGR03905 family TSCPD domain-containing protein [Gammaproteobacteria bacterium]